MDHDRLEALLRSLRDELADAKSVDEESRRLLSNVMADIGRLLRVPRPAADGGLLSHRLGSLAVHFEAEHPAVAGAMRQLMDALAKAGI